MPTMYTRRKLHYRPHNAFYTPDQVREVRQKLAALGERSIADLARELNVPYFILYGIYKNTRYQKIENQ